MDVFESCDYSSTEAFAKTFAKGLKSGDVVRLHGDIGVGKTVFMRGIASCFGLENEVCSPTFAIMNIYAGDTPLYHFDLYRLESEDDIYEIGLYDYMAGNGISVVEWPDLLSCYPKSRIFDVTIEKNLEKSETYRKITVKEAAL